MLQCSSLELNIRRRIEVVITGLTRNIVGSVTHHSLKLRCLSAFTPRAFALSEICISQFSRNLVIRLKPLQFYMETYRSGHNGADSKSVREQSHVGSNPTVSAISARIIWDPGASTILGGSIQCQKRSLVGSLGAYCCF